MTTRQKIELKLSELRSELSTLAGKDALEEGESKRLETAQTEYREAEQQLQAAIISEPAEVREEGKPIDGEGKEKAELLRKSSIASAMSSVARGRAFEGELSELRSAFNMTKDHELPLEFFEPEQVETRQQTETRAVSPAPSRRGPDAGADAATHLPAQCRERLGRRYAIAFGGPERMADFDHGNRDLVEGQGGGNDRRRGQHHRDFESGRRDGYRAASGLTMSI